MAAVRSGPEGTLWLTIPNSDSRPQDLAAAGRDCLDPWATAPAGGSGYTPAEIGRAHV